MGDIKVENIHKEPEGFIFSHARIYKYFPGPVMDPREDKVRRWEVKDPEAIGKLKHISVQIDKLVREADKVMSEFGEEL